MDGSGAGTPPVIGTGTLPADNPLQLNGDAGPVTVSARNITLLGGAGIASTNPSGARSAGGDVTVTATGALTLSGGDGSSRGSHISSDTQGVPGGGAVMVTATLLHGSPGRTLWGRLA
jgi:hypothetical protein